MKEERDEWKKYLWPFTRTFPNRKICPIFLISKLFLSLSLKFSKLLLIYLRIECVWSVAQRINNLTQFFSHSILNKFRLLSAKVFVINLNQNAVDPWQIIATGSWKTSIVKCIRCYIFWADENLYIWMFLLSALMFDEKHLHEALMQSWRATSNVFLSHKTLRKNIGPWEKWKQWN